MKRREFLAMLGGAVLVRPGLAAADTPGRIYRLGTLTPTVQINAASPGGKILIKVLGDRGFNLGQNLTLEPLGAGGDVAKLPTLVSELKSKGVDAIVII